MRTYRIVEDGTEWESRPQPFDNDEHAKQAAEDMGWEVVEVKDDMIRVREYKHTDNGR